MATVENIEVLRVLPSYHHLKLESTYVLAGSFSRADRTGGAGGPARRLTVTGFRALAATRTQDARDVSPNAHGINP